MFTFKVYAHALCIASPYYSSMGSWRMFISGTALCMIKNGHNLRSE